MEAAVSAGLHPYLSLEELTACPHILRGKMTARLLAKNTMDSKPVRISRRLPAHAHIVKIVRERIERGYYAPDEWLPTERDLASELKVSRPVVQVAFKHLREQGLVVQQGPGHRSRISPRVNVHGGWEQNDSGSHNIVAVMSQAPWMAYGFSIVRGINASLREKESSHQLVICDTAADLPTDGDETHFSWEDKYLERIEDEGAAGVILFHVDGARTAPMIRSIQARGVPVVMIDRYSDDIDTDFVGTDNREAAKAAVEYLIELGHRRIGYVVRGERVTSVEERLGGYRDALEGHGIRFAPELITSGWPDAGLALDYYATLESPPTALAMVHDFAAFDLIHAAQSRGIRVPEDLSVVGFDDVEFYTPRPGMLTTVHQPFFEIGRRACELILRRQALPRRSGGQCHRHIFLPAPLVVRTTCCPPAEIKTRPS